MARWRASGRRRTARNNPSPGWPASPRRGSRPPTVQWRRWRIGRKPGWPVLCPRLSSCGSVLRPCPQRFLRRRSCGRPSKKPATAPERGCRNERSGLAGKDPFSFFARILRRVPVPWIPSTEGVLPARRGTGRGPPAWLRLRTRFGGFAFWLWQHSDRDLARAEGGAKERRSSNEPSVPVVAAVPPLKLPPRPLRLARPFRPWRAGKQRARRLFRSRQNG
mmetsp:Transcript_5800/g.12368  ORF Transcript_5800/g.12368 Transcript_5800/m.12368 type:complete len:220 (-) Transcript_5800:141-800(-)